MTELAPFARVRLRAAALGRLRALAAATWPREACGLLVGHRDRRSCDVHEVLAARNRASEPDRFDLDPSDWLRAWRGAEAAGATVVGVWHSHPRGQAVPSAQDRRAAWAEHVQVLAAVDGRGRGEVRAWHCAAGAMVPLALEEVAE